MHQSTINCPENFNMRLSIPALALGLATAAVATLPAVSSQTMASGAQTPQVAAFATLSGIRMNSYEARILALTNSARASAGVASLTAKQGSTDVARRWAYEQARSNTMKHNPSLISAMSSAGSSGWHYLAENVGFGPSSDPDTLFKALMNSPGHRRNILDPRARFIGIGASEHLDTDGNLYTYLTQDFSDTYSSSYGADRVASTGMSRDAWRPLLGGLLDAILPGDQHSDVYTTGGIHAGTVSFTHVLGGYGAVVAITDGGSTGTARLRYHDSIDYRAVHGLIVTLTSSTRTGAGLPVAVDFRNPASGAKSSTVKVTLNTGATQVRIPLPSSFRTAITEVGIDVSRDSIAHLSSTASNRYARLTLMNVKTY